MSSFWKRRKVEADKDDRPLRTAAKALKVEFPQSALMPESVGQTREPETNVDIIAVQGLGSTYESTWMGTDTHGQRHMWLRNFLPKDLPNARICTFEYPSKCFKDPDFLTLSESGRLLLQSIVRDRCHRSTDGSLRICRKKMSRPLILLGHSFGGLVIKQAIVMATLGNSSERNYDIYQEIIRCITGIVFLGTPHKGSRLYASVGTFAAKLDVARRKPAYPEGLEPLMRSSSESSLSVLQDDFQRARKSDLLARLQVMCFWETKGVLGFDIYPVVSKKSATIDGDLNQELRCNHRDLNKFTSREDENYIIVSQLLQELSRASREILYERATPVTRPGGTPSSEEINLIQWIAPISSQERLLSLRSKRLSGTCDWILNEEAFQRWLANDGDLSVASRSQNLWIFGKSGSGKSVLFSYIKELMSNELENHDKSRVTQNDGICNDKECRLGIHYLDGIDEWVLLYFTIGGDVKAGAAQVIASLIQQILRRFSRDPRCIELALKFKDEHLEYTKLPLPLGMELLGLLISKLSRTFILIDGLDECESRNTLLDTLRQLSQLYKVQLLLLGQEEPIIHQSIFDICSKEMTIDLGNRNGVGLSAYINNRMDTIVSETNSKILTRLRRSIVEKLESYSNGMFLWASLVIDEIRPILRDGSDEGAIFEKLEDFPRSLDDAYKSMLDRFGGSSDDSIRARRALRWIICSIRPLEIRELRIILALEETEEEPSGVDQSLSKYKRCVNRYAGESNEAVKEYFVRLLGSLVEIKSDNKSALIVRPCHDSLSRFLTGDHRTVVESDKSGWRGFCFAEAEAHDKASKLCMEVVANRADFEQFLSRYYWTDDKLPFLSYACKNWNRHLCGCGMPYEKPSETMALINKILIVMFESTIAVLAQLALTFTQIDVKKADQMFQLVAFRDCQNAILPAVVALQDASKHLKPVKDSLIDINTELGKRSSSLPKIRRQNTFSRRLKLENSGIDAFLDSIVLKRLQKNATENPDLFEPHMNSFVLLQMAIRKLRALCMRLSVNPVRDLIYDLVGERGTSPIPALALSAQALDTFLVSAFLPQMRHESIDLGDQFICDTSHPYYGMLCGAQMELEERGRNVLNPDFYARYILPHYQLTIFERARLRIEVQVLSESLPSTQYYGSNYAGAIILKSINDPVKWSSVQRSTPFGFEQEKAPYSIVEKFNMMILMHPASTGKSVWISIWSHLSIFNVSPILDVIFTIAPRFVDVFWSLISTFTIQIDRLKDAITLFKNDKRFALYGLVLYVIRGILFPRWFLNYRDSPFRDFKLVLKDPSLYLTNVQNKSFFFWTLKNIFMVMVSTSFNSLKWAEYLNKIDPGKSAAEAEEQRVFKLVLRNMTFTYGRFYRFIELEHSLCSMIYIVIDAISYSTAFYNPNSYVWSKLYNNLCINVLTWRSRDSASQSSVVLGVAMIMLGYLWRWLHLYRLFQYLFNFLIWPLLSYLQGYILKPVCSFVHNGILANSGLSPLDPSVWIRLYISAIHPKFYYPATGFVILAFFYYQVVLVLDPLNIRDSNRSCQKAIELLGQVSGLQNLQWEENSLKAFAALPGLDRAAVPNERNLAVSKVKTSVVDLSRFLPPPFLRMWTAILEFKEFVNDFILLLREQSPDIQPDLLAQQSRISPSLRFGESDIYRNTSIPFNSALVSGLDIKDAGGLSWQVGRDGDLRDVWRQALKGSGRLLSVDSKDQKEVIREHSLNESNQNIVAIGEYLVKIGAEKVVIFLPNSVSLLEALFASVFYNIQPIILPFEWAVTTLVEQLQTQLANADTLIIASHVPPSTEIFATCLGINHAIWVPLHPSPYDAHFAAEAGKENPNVSIAVWYDITANLREDASLIVGGSTPDITMYWPASPVETLHTVPQICLVAGIGASIYDLPQSQRIGEADIFLSTEHPSYSYALVLTLAALMSHATIVFPSDAYNKYNKNLALATRAISPTIILASSSSLTETHMKAIFLGGTFITMLRQRKLDSGTLATGNLLSKIPAASREENPLPLLGADPKALRLIYSSQPIGSKCHVMMSRALMWLRIKTGARFIYALTAKQVAGAVAQTMVYDYQHCEDFSHFGPPASSLEMKFRMAFALIPNPFEQIIVKGPAVIVDAHNPSGEVGLDAFGKMNANGTLSLELDKSSGIVKFESRASYPTHFLSLMQSLTYPANAQLYSS